MATPHLYAPITGNPPDGSTPAAHQIPQVPTKSGPMEFIMAHQQMVAAAVVVVFVLMFLMNQKPKKTAAAGGVCKADEDCTSGACAVSNARAPHSKKACCPSVNTARHLFRNYCADLPVGAACRNNDMCASGKCHGNGFGITTGKCK